MRPGARRAELIEAALPAQRHSVEGAAVAVCLTGVFSRFERKYGEGGYRILAAEAGHLAQNVILAATALGLGARPVGGFFDDLLNGVLGLDTDEEQFLLCVLLGQAPRSPRSSVIPSPGCNPLRPRASSKMGKRQEVFMSETIHELATRCLQDPAFAQAILDGEGHKELKAAINADLEEGADVTGFIIIVGGRVAEDWLSLPRPNLRGLAEVGGPGLGYPQDPGPDLPRG